jgi:hypothetical protein
MNPLLIIMFGVQAHTQQDGKKFPNAGFCIGIGQITAMNGDDFFV